MIATKLNPTRDNDYSTKQSRVHTHRDHPIRLIKLDKGLALRYTVH